MDILTAILACSLVADDALVRAIVDDAHDNPWFIVTPEGDAETGATTTSPRSLDEALRKLEEIINHGGQPLIGPMHIPFAWAHGFGFSPTISSTLAPTSPSDPRSWRSLAIGARSPKGQTIPAMLGSYRADVVAYDATRKRLGCRNSPQWWSSPYARRMPRSRFQPMLRSSLRRPSIAGVRIAS